MRVRGLVLKVLFISVCLLIGGAIGSLFSVPLIFVDYLSVILAGAVLGAAGGIIFLVCYRKEGKHELAQ